MGEEAAMNFERLVSGVSLRGQSFILWIPSRFRGLDQTLLPAPATTRSPTQAVDKLHTIVYTLHTVIANAS